jgi:CRP/FNR family cyclic AMP-dependent transcriptional regulator
MKKVLYILGSLDDADIDWLVTAGQPIPVRAQTPLIREGVVLDALFIVLEGTLKVTVASQPGKTLATSGSGEVLGEISMLDSRPPLATVTAETDCRVLRIPRNRLDEKLKRDSGFAARFYRTLAVFLAQRMRQRTEVAAGKSKLDTSVESEDEIDPEMLDEVALAGKRFEWILQRLKGR